MLLQCVQSIRKEAHMLVPGFPRAIAVALATLFADTAANTAIICSSRGDVLAGQGDCLRTDLKQQAALIAGTLQSSREVQVLSDRPGDELLITQGARENLLCAEVKPGYMLALLVAKDVPLASAKQRTEQALQEVRALL